MQQTKDFNDFTIEKAQYKVVVYKARSYAVMDIYFRGYRETAVRFLEKTFEIIQNNKELTSTMGDNIQTALDFLKENFPRYNWINNLEIIKAIKEDYE